MLAALATPDPPAGSGASSYGMCSDEPPILDGLTTSMASLGSCSSMLEGSIDSLFDDHDSRWNLAWDGDGECSMDAINGCGDRGSDDVGFEVFHWEGNNLDMASAAAATFSNGA